MDFCTARVSSLFEDLAPATNALSLAGALFLLTLRANSQGAAKRTNKS